MNWLRNIFQLASRSLPTLPLLNQIRLAPLNPVADAAAFMNILNDPDVSPYIPASLRPRTLEESHQELLVLSELHRHQRGAFWGIYHHDRLIGTIGLQDSAEYNNIAELSYELLPRYWNQGIVRAAIAMVCPLASELLSVARIHAYVLTENAASVRVLEKCHFQYHSTLERLYNGRMRTVSLYVFLIETP